MIFGRRYFPVAVGPADAAGHCGVSFVARPRHAVSHFGMAGSWNGLGYFGVVSRELFASIGRRRPDSGWDTWRRHFDLSAGGNGYGRRAWIAAMTVAVCLASGLSGPAAARSPASDATGGMSLFGDNCFSPFLTAGKARRAFNLANLRHDFYDLDPFSDVAPSPAKGSVTEGTDRRCEVAFDGDYGARAADAAVVALIREGILTPADLPDTHDTARLPGTTLLAARQLNPNRIAVVHVGTRPGPDGIETFMTLERLRPQQ